MKVIPKIVLILIAVATLAILITFIIIAPPRTTGIVLPAEMDMEQAVESLDVMENTWQTALPQTDIYRLVTEHFNSPLPEGKTKKKAIVIGYDGCRIDTFRLLGKEHDSAFLTLLNDGGHAVFSYCGGVNYPEENIQYTSTAPGWLSMLTGVWANSIGVTDNGQPKPLEPKTMLISLVEDSTIDSSAFYVSWDGHFSKKSATYINEKNYIKEKGLNVNFKRALTDRGTNLNVLSDLKKDDCSDFIFLTLEYTDHNGHNTGFSVQNPNYVAGFYAAERCGKSFIDAIKSRETYDTEDWLILMTTDHGGIRGSHGGSSFDERITYIVSNKDIIE